MVLNKVLDLTKGVNALLCEKDKEALWYYASKVPSMGMIVDIGTAAGGSAFIMALASKVSVKVYTIDLRLNPNFQEKRRELRLEDKIHNFLGTSKEAFSNWVLKKGRSTPIDMLFIDGVHSYPGVKEDFENWGSLVKAGGIVIFHDVLLHKETIGIYVAELIRAQKIKKLRLVKDYFRDDDRVIGLFVGQKL